MTEAKNKAEKEKARLESNMEKMKQQQREKEQRKTTISDNELKRISSIAKTEINREFLKKVPNEIPANPFHPFM